MPKKSNTSNAPARLRRAGVNVALYVIGEADRPILAACHFRGDGWASLDPRTSLDEMVGLLRACGRTLIVEPFDNQADSIEQAQAMTDRLNPGLVRG